MTLINSRRKIIDNPPIEYPEINSLEDVKKYSVALKNNYTKGFVKSLGELRGRMEVVLLNYCKYADDCKDIKETVSVTNDMERWFSSLQDLESSFYIIA